MSAVALRAASQIFDDVVDAAHVETTETGEQVYRVRRRSPTSEVTVTLNPNGTHAGVDWRGKKTKTGYRVVHLQGAVAKYPAKED